MALPSLTDAAGPWPGAREPVPLAARRHPLVAEVARGLTGRCGFAPPGRVVLGVSGGADSLALLLAGVALRHREAGDGRAWLEPLAVHVNHHLRAGADQDATHVAAVCRRLDVPLELRDVRPTGAAGNVWAEARRLRYAALAETACSAGCGFVAVGHHAGDQLETILMALGRGSGLAGLAGMRWSRPLADRVRLARPLLGARRSECEDLCRVAGVSWVEDPTNADPATVRGRLRRDVLPVLETLWPDVASRVAGTAALVEAARETLEVELQRVFGPPDRRAWSRRDLAAAPAALLAAGLRRAALDLAPDVADDLGRAHLDPVAEAVRDDVRRPRRFDWPAGLVVAVTSREVRLSR